MNRFTRNGLLVGLLGLMAACGSEQYARDMLAKEGLTDIELTELDGGKYEFTGKQGTKSCKGTIEVEVGLGSKSFSHSMACF